MGTFVIVHGGFGGGWEWQAFAPLLEAAGHRVYRPTLTGAGERAHLASPAVDLDTHIQDVANVLVYEDLREVVLLGHSYGGLPVTGAADRLPERLRHLVYLDAFLPADGQSFADVLGPQVTAAWEERARALGDGWRLPSPFGVGTARHTPLLMAAFRQPIRLANAAAAVPRTYVYCTDKRDDPVFAPLKATAARLKTAAGWGYRELPTGHMAHLLQPRALADLLLELA
jgi:pimeloyl-ACP methyl ester carboxylesterase